MVMGREWWSRVGIRRKAVLGLVLIPTVFCLIVAGFFVHEYLLAMSSSWFRLRVLEAGEVLYVALVASTAAIAVPAAALLWHGRQKRATIHRSGKWLLLAFSLGLGIAAAEVVCAVKLRQANATAVLPTGGLESDLAAGKSWRFRPPAPLPDPPHAFADADDRNTIDIVVVGESSAEGVPFAKWLSIGKIVAWGLNQVIPGRPAVVRGIAESGNTLERQHERLLSITRKPELFIIYCGHNEFTSRLWWSRNLQYYASDARPTEAERLVDRIERSSFVLRLIQESVNACRIAIPPQGNQRGVVDVPLYTRLEYDTLLADFKRRLDFLVDYARSVGAIPVLVAPPGNDAGFEPNRSFLPAGMPRADRDRFADQVREAARLDARDPDLASRIARYRALVLEQPTFAETHFRLARLLEQAGAAEEAYREYVLARDLDGYPMRMLTPFQDAYRETAKRAGCLLIDGQKLFHAIGHRGQLDNLLFQDAMHPSLIGHVALAQAVLDGLKHSGAFAWPADRPAPAVEPQACLDHFGFKPSDWSAICEWTAGFYNLVAMLRHDPAEREAKEQKYRHAQQQLDLGARAELLEIENLGVPAGVLLRGRN